MKKLETLQQLQDELADHEEYVAWLQFSARKHELGEGQRRILETEKKMVATLQAAIEKRER